MNSNPREQEYEELLLPLLPKEFRSGEVDWPLKVISAHILESLEKKGDLCEFGCLPHMISRAVSFIISALGVNKIAYAFDTFDRKYLTKQENYLIGEEVFNELTLWSAVIPLRPIRGEVNETCKLLNDKISFAWFSLDSAQDIQSIIEIIWPFLDSTTIIGIDKFGNPATTAIESWAEKMVANGKFEIIELIPENLIRLFRPKTTSTSAATERTTRAPASTPLR